MTTRSAITADRGRDSRPAIIIKENRPAANGPLGGALTEIPRSHPRYRSLMEREAMVKALDEGLTTPAGLLAHGRGEALDYLLGEVTRKFTAPAYRAAAALLLLSRHPVISVNGNSTPLALPDTVRLARAIPAAVEVNLFHRTEERVRKLSAAYHMAGFADVLGEDPDALIPGLDHARAMCSSRGIFRADAVLVLLEDGDRTAALKAMGKKVISVDLNPLSRTARASDVCIVDNVTRAMGKLAEEVAVVRSAGTGEKALREIAEGFDREKALADALEGIIEGLRGLEGRMGL